MIRCAWNQLELRLGGIYALERIRPRVGKRSRPIMEVLTTYVREHPPRKRTIKTKKTEIISAPRADIPTILTVIGRRGRTFKKGEDERLYLFRTDLVEANLTFAHLEAQAGSRRMSSGPNVSSASLLGIYILLELGKKLRIVLSGDYPRMKAPERTVR